MSVKQYRKRPVVIEAVRFDGATTSIGAIRRWMETGVYEAPEVVTYDGGAFMSIKTFEGETLASPGDYIIKGTSGEFYPCKPEVFDAVYDEVVE